MLGVLAFQRVHLLGQLDADALLHGHVFVVGVVLYDAALHRSGQCLVVAGSSAVLLAQSVQDTPHRPLLVQDAVVGFLGGLHDHLAKLPVVLAPHQLAKRFPVRLRVGAALVCRAVLFLAFSSIFLRARLFRRAQHLIHLSGSSLPAFALGGSRRRLFCRRSFASAFCRTVSAFRKQLQIERLPRVAAPGVCCALLASCRPRPQQLLPASAAGSGRRRCRKQLQVHRRAAFATLLEAHILRVLLCQQSQTVGHKLELVPHEDAVACLYAHHRAFLALIDAARGVFVLRSAVRQRLHQAAHRRAHDVLPRRGISRVALGPHRQLPALRVCHIKNFDHSIASFFQ